MGTREVYEQKLRSGNLHHDPTLKPGLRLGTPCCPRCLSLLDHDSGKGEWTVTPVLHDATAVAGLGIGGMLSAIHGCNTGIPFLQNRLKGPKSLPFLACSAATLFRCQCCIWRLCTSKVCLTYGDFVLCHLKCLTLRNFASYSTY
ncbi:LOW QUALITY PROTEIN: uncharacterized protein LOC112175118 [Rosa chinensis]|uniref:LOW QUALITY PROTEIN: uncharacterized protein LOC112175118 n=1 Tax=Rosa chinensis TaxID=74649 RepID=UPI000D086EE1|nr:LOW QUALITY PROTEIN: uncharacterized protein LOC112175118 [Rosa chinensis]